MNLIESFRIKEDLINYGMQNMPIESGFNLRDYLGYAMAETLVQRQIEHSKKLPFSDQCVIAMYKRRGDRI